MGNVTVYRRSRVEGLDASVSAIQDEDVGGVLARMCRNANEEAAHENRVAILGKLSAAIAHEVCQPVAGLLTNAQVALRWLALEPPNLVEAREALNRVVRDGNRAAEIVSRVRALSRKVPASIETFDINDVIHESLMLTHSQLIMQRISVETDLATGVSRVSGDRILMQQVIVNLIINAIDAMSTGRRARRKLVIASANHWRQGVRVSVRDYGTGLTAPHVERIFEPFYTTKERGVGMGLSVCRTIVEAHGGQIGAAPATPHGAIVSFTIAANADE